MQLKRIVSDCKINVTGSYCRKKYLEMPEADQTSSNKEKNINSDIHPGENPATDTKWSISAIVDFFLPMSSSLKWL